MGTVFAGFELTSAAGVIGRPSGGLTVMMDRLRTTRITNSPRAVRNPRFPCSWRWQLRSWGDGWCCSPLRPMLTSSPGGATRFNFPLYSRWTLPWAPSDASQRCAAPSTSRTLLVLPTHPTIELTNTAPPSACSSVIESGAVNGRRSKFRRSGSMTARCCRRHQPCRAPHLLPSHPRSGWCLGPACDGCTADEDHRAPQPQREHYPRQRPHTHASAGVRRADSEEPA